MHNYDTIAVRESSSCKYLAGHGIDSTVIPDLSFFSSRGDPSEKEKTGGSLVIDSVDVRVRGSLRRAAKKLGGSFYVMDKRSESARGAGYRRLQLLARNVISLMGLRYVFSEAKKNQAAFFSKSQSRHKSPKYMRSLSIQEHCGFADFLKDLSKRRFIITGRFHGATLSILVGAPALCV